MFYLGTVILGMSEKRFFRTTMRKFIALLDAHKQYNKSPEEKETNHEMPTERMSIRELQSWI